MLENLKSRTVRQMDIHKYQVGLRLHTKPVDALGNTVQSRHHLDFGRHLRQQSHQITHGRFFIFNNYRFHTFIILFSVPI